MKLSSRGIRMNTILSAGSPKWRWIAGTAVHTAAPLWLLLAAILAATMGTWPPHIYI
jgi:hypothetical protein